LSCAVVEVLHAEQCGAAGQANLSLFGSNDAPRVAGVLVESIEPDSANCVLNVELILKSKWDLVRVTDNEEVVRYAAVRGQQAGKHPHRAWRGRPVPTRPADSRPYRLASKDASRRECMRDDVKTKLHPFKLAQLWECLPERTRQDVLRTATRILKSHATPQASEVKHEDA
jgi:hypothetical protein